MPGTINTIATRPTTGQGFLWSEGLGGGFNPGGTLSIQGTNLSGFTQNRVPYGTAAGGLQDSGNLTFDGSTLALTGAMTVSGNATFSARTSTRVAFFGASGVLSDSSGLTYNSGTSALTLGGALSTGGNITMNAGNTENKLSLGNQATSGTYSITVLNQGSTHRAWLFGAQYTLSETFEIVPSTAVGGSSFTTPVFTADYNGSVVLGSRVALSTSATDGFTYLPSCSGTPTGVPTSVTGKVATVIDTSGSKFWAYVGGAWKSATLA